MELGAAYRITSGTIHPCADNINVGLPYTGVR